MSEPRKKVVEEEKSASTEKKTELANRIANQGKKVANTYQHIEGVLLRSIRWFSSFIDKTLFNTKYSKVVSLVLAIILYLIANLNSGNSLYATTLKSSRDVYDVVVTAKYNSDTFELSGLPESANITLIGDASSVTAAAVSRGTAVVDLEGMTEGSYEVKLTTEGFGENVETRVDPSTAFITLKKKTTQQFDLSYDYINLDKLEAIYSVGTPNFEYTRVNVRASKDTLDTIAFVKALIDVRGQTADFEQDAQLVAYDANGQPVNADIYPNTIHVSVPITSPNKTVPIEIEISGEVPDNQAISSIEMDQQTVTIYGPESVLGQIDKVVVTINASTITKDSTLLRPITLPNGVNSSNINQITVNITLGEGVTKLIEDVRINYRNNVNNYKASQPENKTTTSVNVFGTEENIAGITADDISVYVDMKDAKPGLMEFPLQLETTSSGLVKYTLTEATYQLNVLGEQNPTEESEEGAGVNNG